MAAVKFWTRKTFKGTNALERKVNPTRVPIEEKESLRRLENLRQAPARRVHIWDRASDIYERFCAAHQAGTHFLVRTCVDRLAGEGRIGSDAALDLTAQGTVIGCRLRLASRQHEGQR